jgi:secreted Zn-dependent insulinase-like peptidase
MMMVHSPRSKYSKVVLAVNVGTFNNPPHIEGLAHYLEHIAKFSSRSINSTTIYPDCVSKYHGSRNAKTSSQETFFYFKVNKKGFIECLNLLLGFFIDPNINQRGAIKEIDAIDSEF